MPQKLVDVEELEELEHLQAFAFSAATFEIENRKIVVVSPLRNSGRQNSDIAHELAHLMLKHDLSEIREIDGMPFRTCKPDEEEEATAFGGTLLLPRPLLLSAARRRATVDQIATQYDVTVEMARFRFNTTGVAKQAAR
jgi:Zn-dependent peptidase ImmA (M78 family)